MGQPTTMRKRAKALKGRPVCITLHDGRSYVGYITGVEKDILILSRPHTSTTQASGKKRSSRRQKAEISAFMPLIGSLLGGSGAGAGLASGLGGGLRFLGFIQKAMPVMKMGYGMIKTIRPFFNGLKGLMGNNG
ncbi:hypothetical protein A3844_11035 [Paenibacillus helianthi]|uniref:Uncharacterized protein n=1 Tax=Paenibacillus helianthi TaxID=1349432 RepID=A0ABX3ES78_9BACL|nr:MULTISPECIES: hypothetical protein [Paenibacillus]OKP82179.1 hypothetical protein A3848_29660 [Paenibacillus sp. P32E]OKP87025.1 hypothetical protein A3844_11035 [Paenibacillus helianthi]OKP91287.1 hypothetical protein A3842_02930 [Paenibacillus sp. P3E]